MLYDLPWTQFEENWPDSVPRNMRWQSYCLGLVLHGELKSIRTYRKSNLCLFSWVSEHLFAVLNFGEPGCNRMPSFELSTRFPSCAYGKVIASCHLSLNTPLTWRVLLQRCSGAPGFGRISPPLCGSLSRARATLCRRAKTNRSVREVYLAGNRAKGLMHAE